MFMELFHTSDAMFLLLPMTLTQKGKPPVVCSTVISDELEFYSTTFTK